MTRIEQWLPRARVNQKQMTPLEFKKRLLGRTRKSKQVVCKDQSKPSRYPAMKRAEDVQAKLGSRFPSCIKYMLLSNVAYGFWMHFPKRFCNLYLPKCDAKIMLVDERGGEYETKFIVQRCGLSGGWRAFSIAHKLQEGDALVFQFIQPSKCKVYILRSNELNEVDGALGLLDLQNGVEEGILKLVNSRAQFFEASFAGHSLGENSKPPPNFGSVANGSQNF